MKWSLRRTLVAATGVVVLVLPGSVSGSAGCGSGVTYDWAVKPITFVNGGDHLAVLRPDGGLPERGARAVTSGHAQLAQRLELLDSAEGHALIPAGSNYVVRFDARSQRLAEIVPDSNLTDTAREAVAAAPGWLEDALTDNLSRMDADDQDTFAALILDASDPIVDEIAFQVARLAPQTLTHSKFDPSIVAENASLIYEHAPLLAYVELVDVGSAEEGGDYYTTARYRVSTDGELSWLEIPRDIYYWYVVQPKLSDELVKKSAESDSIQSTYGYLWRRYLFSNPDPGHDYSKGPDGVAGHYPVLGDVLQVPQVLWDYYSGNLPKGRPFEPDDVALDVVGNWVSKVLPEKAKGNRPVQPNQIAFEHDGNCGELQDLLGAAARTGLIPVVLISDHCEDHVWNEFFASASAEGWHPYQVSWDGGPTHINNPSIAMDRDCGGGKDISAVWAWRPDGHTYDVVDRYSNAATLIVRAKDGLGLPVDGAQVLLASEAWQSESIIIADWCYTGTNGECVFKLGDNQNYYFRVSSRLGNYPPEANQVRRVIESAQADRTYEVSAVLSGRMGWHRSRLAEVAGDDLDLRVTFEVPSEIVYDQSLVAEQPVAAVWSGPGSVDAFVVNEKNYALMESGEQFETTYVEKKVSSGELQLGIPDTGSDWYVVLSNQHRLAVSQVVDAHVEVYGEPRTNLFLPLAYDQASQSLTAGTEGQ